MANLDDFTAAYIETALWCGAEFPEGHPDADHDRDYNRSIDDLAPETLARMIADCLDFQHHHGATIAAAIETGQVVCGPDFDEYGRAGHDFWLNRNGHGAGFWDGDWPEPYASQLDKAAHNAGECDLYVGDDGKVYIL